MDQLNQGGTTGRDQRANSLSTSDNCSYAINKPSRSAHCTNSGRHLISTRTLRDEVHFSEIRSSSNLAATWSSDWSSPVPSDSRSGGRVQVRGAPDTRVLCELGFSSWSSENARPLLEVLSLDSVVPRTSTLQHAWNTCGGRSGFQVLKSFQPPGPYFCPSRCSTHPLRFRSPDRLFNS